MNRSRWRPEGARGEGGGGRGIPGGRNRRRLDRRSSGGSPLLWETCAGISIQTQRREDLGWDKQKNVREGGEGRKEEKTTLIGHGLSQI